MPSISISYEVTTPVVAPTYAGTVTVPYAVTTPVVVTPPSFSGSVTIPYAVTTAISPGGAFSGSITVPYVVKDPVATKTITIPYYVGSSGGVFRYVSGQVIRVFAYRYSNGAVIDQNDD